MPDFLQFVDSHMHLDQVAKHHPGRIDWLKKTGCLAVSWAWCPRVVTVADLAAYFSRMTQTLEDLEQGGLACRFLAGVHPRNITDDLGSEHIPELLLPLLEHPLCVGIGETGLETASQREKEILAAQVEWFLNVSKQKDLVLGVHTPRTDKDRVAQETLDLLAGFDLPKDRVVVDHLTRSTVPLVLKQGYYAGVTLSPIKSSADDLLAMAQDNPGHKNRIMANTDSGTEFYTDLGDLARNPPAGADPALITRLTRDNALGFFLYNHFGDLGLEM